MKNLKYLFGLPFLLLPCESQAHIKWFCAYDTTIPPRPIAEVITPTFLALAIGFSTLMFIAYAIDRVVDRTQWAKRFDDVMFSAARHLETIIRIVVGVLFLVLWHSAGVILTPELKTASSLIPWIQLGIAATMLFRSTLILGATGMVGLYAYGIKEFGAFHMMDYPIFPAIAVYLALAQAESAALRATRLPVLYAGVAATMMWGAIEKFGYPYWTFPLLAQHAELTLGIGFEPFMCLAAFIEFSLAFFMVTGTALLRWSCAALLVLLLSAVPEFGKVDAVGHAVIIASLVVMIIAGQRSLRAPAVLPRNGILREAGMKTCGYVLTLPLAFGLYYGSQFLAGR